MLCFNEKNWSLPQAFHVSAVRPEPGTRDSVGALVGWVKHELVTDAIEYIGKTLSDVEITIVERFSDLDLTDAPTYESAAFSDIAHEIIIKFSSPAYVLEIGQEYATIAFSKLPLGAYSVTMYLCSWWSWFSSGGVVQKPNTRNTCG